MNLINKTTAEVIVLINSNETGIAYDLYENGYNAEKHIYNYRKTSSKTINKDTIPLTPMSINEMVNKLSYDILISELVGFEVSEFLQNWCIETGSSGLETLVRIIIPNSLIVEHVYTSSPLGQLINAMSPLISFTTKDKHSTIQYLEDILPEHKSILDLYPDIIIDYKYPQE